MTKQTRKVLHSSKRSSWCTPEWFVQQLWSFGNIGLDPCSNAQSIVNAQFECVAGRGRVISPRFYANNGLIQDWKRIAAGDVVYVNPPYGRGVIEKWIKKCDEEAAAGAEIIALVPARTDTKWYQGNRRTADVEVLGRLTFRGAQHPAPFPSSIFYWGRRVDHFSSLFGPLGRLHVVIGTKRPERVLGGAQRPDVVALGGAPGTRAALYHRVSTIDQDPAGARLELRAAAAARGLEVTLEVNEIGSGAMNDRPGLLEVMEAAKTGKVSAVVVWKLDRFGRSALDLLHNIQQLEDAGVRFIATTQGIDVGVRGGDPMSRFMVQVLAGVAEFERSLIIERTILALRRARERGVRLGRPLSRNAPASERVLELRAAGLSWSQVADELQCGVKQARGAITPHRLACPNRGVDLPPRARRGRPAKSRPAVSGRF